MTAVVNTSPLVVLTKVGRLGLLPTLYGDVVVPQEVVDEVLAKRELVTPSGIGLSTAVVFELRRTGRCSGRSHSTSVLVKLRRLRLPPR